jgi:hypothetical protein
VTQRWTSEDIITPLVLEWRDTEQDILTLEFSRGVVGETLYLHLTAPRPRAGRAVRRRAPVRRQHMDGSGRSRGPSLPYHRPNHFLNQALRRTIRFAPPGHGSDSRHQRSLAVSQSDGFGRPTATTASLPHVARVALQVSSARTAQPTRERQSP